MSEAFDAVAAKRKAQADNMLGSMVPFKKTKVEESPKSMMLAERKAGDLVLAKGPQRTSGLSSPTMKLTGHKAAVLCCKFNKEGTVIATAGDDKDIFLWNVYGDCKNIGVLSGHKGPVLDLNWGRDGKLLYSASADQSACVWDLSEMQRIKKIKGHTSYVNCITPSRRGDPLCVTGSDDCTAMVWDIRRKNHVYKFDNEYQVLGACFSDDSSQVFTAGIDEKIHCWDLRTEKKLYSLTGHTNTITGISLSADGSYIVSNSRDQTVRTWDVRPYVSQGKSRMVGVYEGASHDFQELMLRASMSADGSKITCGSADRFVYVWDTHTRRILYKLPGHKGCVNQVEFHPTEPIIVSAGSDKVLYLGEIIGGN